MRHTNNYSHKKKKFTLKTIFTSAWKILAKYAKKKKNVYIGISLFIEQKRKNKHIFLLMSFFTNFLMLRDLQCPKVITNWAQ